MSTDIRTIGGQAMSDRSKTATILLVDDDLFFREFLSKVLKAHGYNTLEARSVMEAEQLLWQRPDLVIVDYRMPQTDGVTWINALRDRGVKIPVVFCSGSTYSNQTLTKLRNVMHVELIVRKPLDVRSFISQLKSILPIAPHEEQIPAYVEENLAEEEKDEESIVCPDFLAMIAAADHINMMEDDQLKAESEVIEVMQELGQEYLTELTEINQEIKSSIESAREGKHIIHLEEATQKVHKVRGTAGTLGFGAISDAAASLEDKLNQALLQDYNPDGGDIKEVERLFDRLATATSAEYPGSSGNYNCQTEEKKIEKEDSINKKTLVLAIADDITSKAIKSICRDLKDIKLMTIDSELHSLSGLDHFEPDILILGLGTRSSADFCSMLRRDADWLNRPIFIVTDDCYAENRNYLYDKGATDFIVSPLIEREVIARLAPYRR